MLLALLTAAGCGGGEVVRETPPADVRSSPEDAATDVSAIDVAAPPDVASPDVVTPTDLPSVADRAESLDVAAPRDVTAPRDAPAPTVSVRITAPANAATVSGVVTITAAAAATAGVARVVFFSEGGGYRIGEDIAAPYAIDWYTDGYVPDGAQRLRAVAYDAAGRSATHEVDVRVRNAPDAALPPADVARVTAYFEARRDARYMEGDCQPTTWPGWSGIPLQRCRYRVSDVYSGGTRWADVVLADASPAQIARWVVQAALERRGRVLRSDTDALSSNILGQSGGQFPVAGVVYEDMDGSGQRIYPFRDGVTVGIQGLPYATREQPDATQMAAYRTNPVAFVGSYGRIAGTRPEQWTALTGERVAADRMNWPAIVGRAYRAAWGQDRNALLVAWARANL